MPDEDKTHKVRTPRKPPRTAIPHTYLSHLFTTPRVKLTALLQKKPEQCNHATNGKRPCQNKTWQGKMCQGDDRSCRCETRQKMMPTRAYTRPGKVRLLRLLLHRRGSRTTIRNQGRVDMNRDTLVLRPILRSRRRSARNDIAGPIREMVSTRCGGLARGTGFWTAERTR